MKPDILLAGHIVRDITPSGWRAGGGVTYAAVQARRFGLSVAVVTSCAPDIDPQDIVSGVEWRVIPSKETTSFENVYDDGHRTQRVLSRAEPIRASDIPADWLDAPLVLLCPVIGEVDAHLDKRLKRERALIGVGAQGWLRRLEGDQVVADHVEAHPAWLEGADIVFVSEEDLADAAIAAEWRTMVPIIVLTRGKDGCTVWDRYGEHDIAPFDTVEVDPTGAGDVFATAFTVRYRETADSVDAARFGSAAAALSIRALGTQGIARREEIENLLRTQRAVYGR